MQLHPRYLFFSSHYMRLVLQRTTRAEVRVNDQVIGKIQKGLMVLLGVANSDTDTVSDVMIEKMINLRIFEDENGKMNLSLLDCSGELLVISQFTLYADCRGGRRPGFTDAGAPDFAKDMYKKFIQKCKDRNIQVAEGEFGADMKVDFINDGPVTIVLDSKDFTVAKQS